MQKASLGSLREKAIAAIAILLGAFIFYTSFEGPFESLVQRSVFVLMIATLAVLMYPLFSGTRLRPLGIAIDAAIVVIVTVSTVYIVRNYQTIMTELPWAKPVDMIMAFGTLAAILELGRRTGSSR